MTDNELWPPKQTARVTLECGHIRLMPWRVTVGGIGAQTACFICPERPSRQIVNVEDALTHWYESMWPASVRKSA